MGQQQDHFEDAIADGLMDARETCKFFGIGKTTLWDWTRRGLIKSVKIRGSRRWIRRSVIECAESHVDHQPEFLTGGLS